MGTPMSDRQRQQRAAMIVGGAAVGGLAIIGLAIALSSGGGDDTNAIDVRRSTTTSSSTTSSSSTSTSTSTTTTLITLPLTVPPTAPPTIITVPTLPPPTDAPTTAAPTTSPPTTKPPTTTTKPVPPNQQLALTLDTALNGGQPDPPPRVSVKPIGNNKTLDVTWALDASLAPDEQGIQAREDTLVLFQTIQSANPPSNDRLKLKGTLPGPGRVILLVIDRSQFDAFDFSTFDPDTTDVFTLPFVKQSQSDIDTTYVPDPYPPSSTTSSSTSTTTTTS